MMTAKVFQSGNSQAIRIPKEVQTDQKEFLIRKVGEGYILCPIDDPWFPLRQSIMNTCFLLLCYDKVLFCSAQGRS